METGSSGSLVPFRQLLNLKAIGSDVGRSLVTEVTLFR
jgi:hypothetical protein